MFCLLISVHAGAGPIPEFGYIAENAESFPPLMIPKQPQASTDNSALQGTKVRDWRELLSSVYFEPVKNNTSEKHTLSGYQPDIQFQAIASSVDGTFNMSQDMNQDAEPSVISINKNGTVWTTTVYMKYLNTPEGMVVRNYFSTTANGVNFTRGQLPIPANYTRSGDPLMAHNPYSYGIAPGRIYATGNLFHIENGQMPASGIALWRSDDGGNSWYYSFPIPFMEIVC